MNWHIFFLFAVTLPAIMLALLLRLEIYDKRSKVSVNELGTSHERGKFTMIYLDLPWSPNLGDCFEHAQNNREGRRFDESGVITQFSRGGSVVQTTWTYKTRSTSAGKRLVVVETYDLLPCLHERTQLVDEQWSVGEPFMIQLFKNNGCLTLPLTIVHPWAEYHAL